MFFISFRNKRREQLCTAASLERLLICCDEVASHRNSPSVSSALGGLSGWGRVSHFDAVCSVRHRVRGGDTFASEGAGSFASSPTATVRTPPQSRPCLCCFLRMHRLGVWVGFRSAQKLGCRHYASQLLRPSHLCSRICMCWALTSVCIKWVLRLPLQQGCSRNGGCGNSLHHSEICEVYCIGSLCT